MKMQIRMPRFFAVSALLISFFLANEVLASEVLTKKINKVFKVGAEHQLEIKNQFGDVEINSWDKQEIKIDVEVIVDYKNEEKSREMLDQIRIEISEKVGLLIVETNFAESTNGIKLKGNDQLEVNYKVMMPATNSLKLSNKFGDLTIGELSGTTEISLQFGSAKIGKLMHSKNKLELKFVDPMIIDEFNAGSIDLKFSKLDLNKCGDLDLKSQMSTLKFGEMGNVDLDIKYGSFEASSIEKLLLISSMSTIRINELELGGEIKASYGKVIISKLHKTFKGLKVNSSFGPVEIGIEKGSVLELDANTSMADLNLPSGYKVVNKSDVKNENSFQGAIGGNGDALPLLKIDNSFGNIKIN